MSTCTEKVSGKQDQLQNFRGLEPNENAEPLAQNVFRLARQQPQSMKASVGPCESRPLAREAGPNDKYRHRVWPNKSPWPDVAAGEWQMPGAQYDLLGNPKNSVPKKVHEQSATTSSQKIQLIKLPGLFHIWNLYQTRTGSKETMCTELSRND